MKGLSYDLLAGLLYGFSLFSAGALAIPVVIDQTTIQGDFNQPTRAIEDDSANLYVLDGANNAVVKIDAAGKHTVFGEQQLLLPMDIAITSNNTLIIADTGHHRLVEFNLTGQLIRTLSLNSVPTPNADIGPRRILPPKIGLF